MYIIINETRGICDTMKYNKKRKKIFKVIQARSSLFWSVMKTGSLRLYFALVLPEEYSFMFNICIVRYMVCLVGWLFCVKPGVFALKIPG